MSTSSSEIVVEDKLKGINNLMDNSILPQQQEELPEHVIDLDTESASQDSSVLQRLLPEVVVEPMVPASNNSYGPPPSYTEAMLSTDGGDVAPPPYLHVAARRFSLSDIVPASLEVSSIRDIGEDTRLTVEVSTRSAGRSRHEVWITREQLVARNHNDECLLASRCRIVRGLYTVIMAVVVFFLGRALPYLYKRQNSYATFILFYILISAAFALVVGFPLGYFAGKKDEEHNT
ncbi:hypothetical protein [Candidatus Ichthyocystis hellenicum]|uniref:hypothetical protein n=1 Tax=Candidatus Ichthyocystis hellenicum TaxID=1561003 RepID=UPI0011125786|nr:hypothetical protein [Candidatus Ichthyocystis hellenicum]